MLSRRSFLFASAVPALNGQDGARSMFANAEAYERFMGRWSRLVAPRLVDFAEPPVRGRVLDAGSGTGSLAFAIAERRGGVHVTGIDPSTEYVAYANRENPFPGRVEFQAGDAQQTQFPDAAFGASLSLLVFNFIPDPAKALRELRRITRQGGTISAAVWDYGEGMSMLRVFWDAVIALDPQADRIDEKHMPLCRAGDLAGLWKRSGLVRTTERAIDITTRFTSMDDYWDPFLLGQGPAGAYVSRLNAVQRQALRNEVKRRLSLPAEGKPFDLTARVWAVRGTVPKVE